MFSRVLIANRGEIAVRVIRACRELGIESVAVYSEPDRHSLHVGLADRAVPLGGAAPRESYLDIARVIDAARLSGSEAIHPGYGFLSENAEFARACEQAGVVFVGPTADAIARLGSKIEARRLAVTTGVPVVPGEAPDDQSSALLAAAIARTGFPAVIKPSAGGGGIGMRAVRTADEVAEAIAGAKRDARAAFGDDTLYVERLIEQPRHVEIQVIADRSGHAVHALERECSLQRRHQKVIEESPSVVVTPALRARMGEAAVAIARAAGYRNAGTVEFLVEGAGDEARFYFLEMNTRLQVEHPVTELVAGIDLVQAQLRIAAGEALTWQQQDVSPRGHAIECRVYAEDPAAGFLPQAGRLLLYREPSGPGIRVDSGVVEGSEVPVHYDPLIAKLIVWAETREWALARARTALSGFVVLGVRTNIPYLVRVLAHDDMAAGRFDTLWLDGHTPGIAGMLADEEPRPEALAAASAAYACHRTPVGGPSVASYDPWATLGHWSIGG